jgi:hypothetical protein
MMENNTMTTKTIGDMTEQDLRELVNEIVEQRLTSQKKEDWRAEVERQWAMMHPDDRTPEARVWLEKMINPNRAETYDPEKDIMLHGLFDGPTDLASRTTEILRAEMGLRKDD